MDETVAFLKANKTETAVLKFSHIRGHPHDPTDTFREIDVLLTGYQDMIYCNPLPNVNLATIALKELRGKMVLVFDYDGYIDQAAGRFRYYDGCTQPSGNITVCDRYSDTANYTKMKAGQLAKWKEYAKLNAGHLFLLSWTLTASNPPLDPTIRALAEDANARLPGVLHDQIVTSGWAKPNIVYLDYVDSATCQSIIRYNFLSV
jgi:hypothetical protein